MGENKIIKMDARDFIEFVRALDLFKTVGNGQMQERWEIFSNVPQATIKALLASARQAGVAVSVEYSADSATTFNDIVRMYDLGFTAVSLDLQNLTAERAAELLDALKDHPLVAVETPAGVTSPSPRVPVVLDRVGMMTFSPDDVIDVAIPDGLSREAMRGHMERLPLANTIVFNRNDAAKLIDGTADILEKKTFASLLSLLLNFGKTDITTPETARRLGHNWRIAELPVRLEGEAGRVQLQALFEGVMGGSGISPDTALYRRATEFADAGLRKAFLGAIAEEMLIVSKLSQGNDALFKDYVAGKFTYGNHAFRQMLGRMLALQAGMSPGELRADQDSARALGADVKDVYASYVLQLFGEIESGRARSGTMTMVIAIILRDIGEDYNLKRKAVKQGRQFDTRAVEMLLQAA